MLSSAKKIKLEDPTKSALAIINKTTKKNINEKKNKSFFLILKFILLIFACLFIFKFIKLIFYLQFL